MEPVYVVLGAAGVSAITGTIKLMGKLEAPA